MLLLFFPFLSTMYALSPYRDHKRYQKVTKIVYDSFIYIPFSSGRISFCHPIFKFFANTCYRFRGPLAWFLSLLDRPINRFILDLISHCLFLVFLLVSVAFQIEKDKKIGTQEAYNLTPITWVILIWACASLIRDLHSMWTIIAKKGAFFDRRSIFYDFVSDVLFITAIITKV